MMTAMIQRTWRSWMCPWRRAAMVTMITTTARINATKAPIGTAPTFTPISRLRCSLALAAGDLEQKQPVHHEARRDEPGEAGDQRPRRPEDADDDGRNRQSRDQQDAEQEVHARGDGSPGANR